jgi:hypothetical protein
MPVRTSAAQRPVWLFSFRHGLAEKSAHAAIRARSPLTDRLAERASAGSVAGDCKAYGSRQIRTFTMLDFGFTPRVAEALWHAILDGVHVDIDGTLHGSS